MIIMVYAVANDVRMLTGWSTATISDATVGSLITMSDGYIDALGITGTTAQLSHLSSLYAAHLGELNLRGNLNSFSSAGTNITFNADGETAWLKTFNSVKNRYAGIQRNKVWSNL